MDTRTPLPESPWQPEPSINDAPLLHRRLGMLAKYIISFVLVVTIAIGMVTTYLEKWLWMGRLDYSGIFWTLFSIQWTMYALSFIAVFGFVWLNLRHALQNGGIRSSCSLPVRTRRDIANDSAPIALTPQLLHAGAVIVSLGIAWVAANIFFSEWDTYLRFRYGGEFGMADPLYGIDIGFYVFQLPFYRLLQTSVVLLSVLAIGGIGFVYSYFQAFALSGAGDAEASRLNLSRAIPHLSALLLLLVASLGVCFVLDHRR